MKATSRASVLITLTIAMMISTMALASSMLLAQPAFADEGLSAAASDLSAQAGDSKDAAKKAALNKKTSGVLTSDNDENWYKVSLSEAGRFQLVFGGEGGLLGSYKISLYDSSTTEIWSGNVLRLNMQESTLVTTGLPKGTYYIRVQQAIIGVLDWTYYVIPKFTASAAWETEFNDSKATADAAKLGKKTMGNLQTQADEDWYKVNVSDAGKFTMKFGGDASNVTRVWTVTLYNENEDAIYTGTYTEEDGKDQVICTTGLPKGTYYVRVQNGILANGSNYHFTMKVAASTAWESETNDAVASADKAAMNKTYRGVIQRIGDEDWYAFDIKNPGRLYVTFGGEFNLNASWTMTLYNSVNTPVAVGTHAANATSDSVALQGTVSSGTYYLCVRSLNATGLAYRFLATSETPIASATVSKIPNATYTGKAQKPVPTLTIGNDTLKEGTDYTLSYKSNKNAGTATVTAKGKGTYSGTTSTTFTIKPASISKATVKSVAKKTYTGKAQKPNATVTLNGTKLKKGTDFTLSYKSNKNVGTATVKAKGTGNYKGTAITTFTIKKATNKVTAKSLKKTFKAKASTGKLAKTKSFKIAASSKWSSSKVTFAKANKKGGSKIVVSKAGKVTVKKGLKAGTYKVKVKVKSKAAKNYKAATKTITATVKVS